MLVFLMIQLNIFPCLSIWVHNGDQEYAKNILKSTYHFRVLGPKLLYLTKDTDVITTLIVRYTLLLSWRIIKLNMLNTLNASLRLGNGLGTSLLENVPYERKSYE